MSYLALLCFLLGIMTAYIMFKSDHKSKSQGSVDDIIKKIIRQAARWTTASEQDTNPLIKVLHANYGAAYIFALGDAGINPDQIERVIGTGFNYNTFRDHIVQIQDDASKSAVEACPSFGPPDNPFNRIAGE